MGIKNRALNKLELDMMYFREKELHLIMTRLRSTIWDEYR